MSRRIDRAVQSLLWKSSLPAHAMTIVPWVEGSGVELRAWLDPAFAHAACELPQKVHGIQVCVFARPTGVPQPTTCVERELPHR